MQPTPVCSEEERLNALYQYDILDTPTDHAFDELASLAANLFNAPIAVVNFIDRNRQWFKSEVGLGVRETPLETSFCAHALLEQDLLVVPDTRCDSRFKNNPLVTGEPHLRFYAGALLRGVTGHALGTLCILDYQARDFTECERQTLRVLANQVMSQLEQRRLFLESEKARVELARLNHRLQGRERSNDQFLAMISHELRNPLSSLTMGLDFLGLKGKNFDQDVIDSIESMGRQTKLLVRLVDDLLDTSRIATGNISLQRTLCDITTIIDDSVAANQKALLQKNQQFSLTVPENTLTLSGDQVRLTQLVTNLLANAVRYTPTNGHVQIETKAIADDYIEVRVTDNGCGISSEFLERIFDSFVQAPNACGQLGGLGIGLHLCKHIVQLHGGTIQAFSEGEGRGAVFVILLPRNPK
ncbi:GAF domain-containing sensor histidine kinase [Gilvimarinus agarilyticus]|uniref:GAF domain-containing sensor histidine kinase n=1 Tax=unclassified Gilvimarinus TaxID=2642066 RepID=UPI001C091E64|nr:MULTISPECIES: GAF domain-containing sensor histidine kinase [unclassified Gilvimarinus]MBU2886505.1 GAF domain-containing sensor histidine kinase [Gilvimarinus agarilyticus]MDO6571173.1 GAF domain-containing sensor histidine kinase [Gilvimarinus sp. 2_MG-2023]MDO6746446.1 GAF domain-containing sensor histidine kinase [Gilvimarinus sp. 1_MG-2023]